MKKKQLTDFEKLVKYKSELRQFPIIEDNYRKSLYALDEDTETYKKVLKTTENRY